MKAYPKKHNNEAEMKFVEFIKKPKTIIIFAVVVALLLALIPILITIFNKDNSASGVSFVTLDAGAALTFKTDADGRVLAIYSSNEDGDVALTSDYFDDVSGENIITLSKRFVDVVALLGYLDMEAGALKIITPTSNFDALLGERLESELISYVKSEGIYSAVFQDVESVDNYKTLNGFGGKIASLERLFANTTAIYNNRGIENLNKSKLKEKYESSELSGLAASIGRVKLDEMLETVDLQIDDLRDLIDLADEIEAHGDNPLFSENKNDYFTVISGYTDFTEDFEALLLEMSSALDEYESSYGTRIESNTQLRNLFQKARGIDTVRAKLDSVEYRFHIDESLEYFAYFGRDTSDISLLYSTPDTVDEYNEITTLISYSTYNRLYDMNFDVYSEERETISDEDYDAFISELLSEYETLADYFNDIY